MEAICKPDQLEQKKSYCMSSYEIIYSIYSASFIRLSLYNYIREKKTAFNFSLFSVYDLSDMNENAICGDNMRYLRIIIEKIREKINNTEFRIRKSLCCVSSNSLLLTHVTNLESGLVFL